MPIAIASIVVPPDRRAIDEQAVQRLAESMGTIGLETPITAWANNAQMLLVAGAYRLRAAEKLGWTEIDAFVATGPGFSVGPNGGTSEHHAG